MVEFRCTKQINTQTTSTGFTWNNKPVLACLKNGCFSCPHYGTLTGTNILETDTPYFEPLTQVSVTQAGFPRSSFQHYF